MQEDNLEVIQLQNSAKEVLPPIYPFVKWAGGKTQLLQQLYESAPARFDRYFEPFLDIGTLSCMLFQV